MTEATTKKRAAKPKASRKTTAKTGARKPKAAKATKTSKTAKAVKNPFEQASGLIVELTRTNFDETVDTARAVLTAKDLRLAVELQNDFVRAAVKRNVEAARELNGLAVNLVRETVTPYTDRVTSAFEKLRAA